MLDSNDLVESSDESDQASNMLTSTERARLLEKYNCNPPASAAALAELERQSKFRIPAEHMELLRHCNGGEGFVGPNAYLILWRVEELPPTAPPTR